VLTLASVAVFGNTAPAQPAGYLLAVLLPITPCSPSGPW
jgi:hypothetical protein